MLTPCREAERNASGIQPFGIDQVAAAAGDAPDVLRMENLDTDIPVPPSAVAATRDAVGTDGANSWLPFTGLAPLREAVAERLQAQSGRAYDPLEEVVITSGALPGLLSALLATVDHGDEVVVTDPTYAGFIGRIRLAGARPVFVPLVVVNDRWRPDALSPTACWAKETTMKLHDFPRYPLTFGPSPIHQLDRLTKHLAGATVWAKREDCNSGLAFGGNKVRKLEYLVPDALAKGADTLVSIGGVQSNHTRQVAAVAAKLGLKCLLVQEKWVDWDDPGNDKVGNILLSRIMGADVRLNPAGFDIGIRSSWEDALREVENAGGKPYGIPAGASEHPLGGLGFANWAFEVAEQEKQVGVYFDTIVVCTVTGSTHAGMVAGFAALQETADNRPRRVLGIDASATLDKTRDQVARIARHTAELIELGRDLRDDEITVLGGWAGDFYGIPVKSTIEAIRLSGSLEGMIIDPVYEGKSMAGLIDLVSSGEIPKHSTVLYAHLGGQPALNAYSGIFD